MLLFCWPPSPVASVEKPLEVNSVELEGVDKSVLEMGFELELNDDPALGVTLSSVAESELEKEVENRPVFLELLPEALPPLPPVWRLELTSLLLSPPIGCVELPSIELLAEEGVELKPLVISSSLSAIIKELDDDDDDGDDDIELPLVVLLPPPLDLLLAASLLGACDPCAMFEGTRVAWLANGESVAIADDDIRTFGGAKAALQ